MLSSCLRNFGIYLQQANTETDVCGRDWRGAEGGLGPAKTGASAKPRKARSPATGRGAVQRNHNKNDAAIPAVSYEYTRAPSSRMTARSVTKVTLDPPDESAIETLILIDGLGRPIYTSRSISTA